MTLPNRLLILSIFLCQSVVGFSASLNAKEMPKESASSEAQSSVHAAVAYKQPNRVVVLNSKIVRAVYDNNLIHYAPCNVAASGFKCVVVLPKGTNTDITLEEKHTPEDDLLFARNKWLLSHPDANIAGSVAGIKGENLSVK